MQIEAKPRKVEGDADSLDTMVEAPFYIPATGPSARPRRVLKHGDTFAVFDSHGDMGASAGGPDGLFDHDTRYLSRLELLIDGMQPLLLGSSVRDDNLTLTADLTNPDIFYGRAHHNAARYAAYRSHRLSLEGRRASAYRDRQSWRERAQNSAQR
jgi:N-terminal domain of (some) glycogen debranching enzymes